MFYLIIAIIIVGAAYLWSRDSVWENDDDQYLGW